MFEVVVITAVLHLACCPFTKVEESFNLQAIHDIIYHRHNISKYDHLEFPGVVPRTFLGPLFVAFLSSPLVVTMSTLGLSKLWSQYIVRGVLGLCVIFGLMRFHRSISLVFGKQIAHWHLLLMLSQYHFMFYLSRPLPNIMALPWVLLALDAWLRRKHTQFLWLSGIAIIWFRAELALLLGPFLLMELYHKSLNPAKLLKIGVPVGLMLLAATVIVDSVFWRRLVWPEAEVWWFNVVLNKSSDWGTSPFLWYWYSALPRAMAFSLALVPVGYYLEGRVRNLCLPALIFILLFSFLPHKELRFIIYVFPLLNVAAACACNRIWVNRSKSRWWKLVSWLVASHILLNSLLTWFLLMVSSANYPGGAAMLKLQTLINDTRLVSVHIDNLAAQTGVSRFLETNPHWRYNKTENLTPGGPEMLQFTHLLIEAKSKYSTNLRPYLRTYDIIDVVEGFSQITLNYQTFPPLRIKTKPMIFILAQKDYFHVPFAIPSYAEKYRSEEDEQVSEETIADTVDIIEPNQNSDDRNEEIDTEEPYSKEITENQGSDEPYSKKTIENQGSEELDITQTQQDAEVQAENTNLSQSNDRIEVVVPAQSLDSTLSIDMEIEQLGRDILDDETLTNINELVGNMDEETVKIKEDIKRLLKEYRQKMVVRGNTSGMEKNNGQGDLEEALSMKETSIITDDGVMSPEDSQKKKKKKAKKKKQDGDREGEEWNSEDWLSLFR